jgi:hypothetical protein
MAGINPEARKAQVEVFNNLTKQSYDQLRGMPDEKYLPLPETARGSTVCVRKREMGLEGIEVEVVLRQRFLLFFHGMLRKSFRINSSGVVSDGEYETYKRPSSEEPALPQRKGLPQGIEHDLVEYLRTELGEHEGMSDALRVGDLEYAGMLQDGVKIVHYWRVPARKALWGTVTFESGRLQLSTSNSEPGNLET